MTSDVPRDPLVGLHLGEGDRYGILRLIGRGGSGSIYLAFDDVEHRTVALKLLHADHAGKAHLLARFERERRLLESISHPNLVGIFGGGRWEGRLYIVMEYVAGKNLYQLMRREGAFATRRALGVCLHAAQGLAAVHAHGFVHRDVKPENIMVRTEDQVVKVLDFGIAKDLHASLEITRLGSYLGTPAYSAPEQVRGEKVDGRADVFSLGVILYELLTGKVAFEGRHSTEILEATLNEDPVPIDDLNLEVTHPVARLLERMIEKNPAHRFEKMDYLIAEIERALPKIREEMSDDEHTSVRVALKERFRKK